MAHFITTQKPIKFLHVFLTLVSLISPLLSSSPPPPSIHDLLVSRGLPKGLLPKEVKSYTLSDNGTSRCSSTSLA
ncbi:hypothetical protein Gogos_009465 [Gossypium gossypioides]|uniref:Uncharacterized protein n=1 Tax=Gossypium gossypioides TaxID=34282 RepID=A0A7J9CFS5_GOSGO|nr:hypothetical protein [Gossypium gossypioides]